MTLCIACVLLCAFASTVVTTRIKTSVKSVRVSSNSSDSDEALAPKPGSKNHNILDETFLDDLKPGTEGGPLIPALVGEAGQVFEVNSRGPLPDSNMYHWTMLTINDNGKEVHPAKWFAMIDGDYAHSLLVSWKTTVVRNNHGAPLFKIYMSKHKWNPTRWTWSFRIGDPHNDDILFTVNKDWVGTGMFFAKDEWRVYRGRKSAKSLVYYCVSSYVGHDRIFYHSKDEYQKKANPIAQAEKSVSRHLFGMPDVYSLMVMAGEDTALLLATTVIIDMVHQQEHGDAEKAALLEVSSNTSGATATRRVSSVMDHDLDRDED